MFIFDWVFSLFKIWRGVFSLISCLVLSALMLSMDKTEKALFHEVAVSTVLSPAQSLINVKRKYFDVYAKNEVLKQENFRLKIKNDELRHYKLQNQRLREMLNFKFQSGYTVIPAEVVARNPVRYETSWIVNLGYGDDISVNMPVLTSKGIVGKVAKTFRNFSVVQLLQDPNCKVSVVSQRSRVIGIMESYKLNELVARFPAHSDVVFGDTLVTSGMGGVFPKGISIGVVSDENKDSNDIIKGVGVRQFQNINIVEEVFIYIKQSDWVVGDNT